MKRKSLHFIKQSKILFLLLYAFSFNQIASAQCGGGQTQVIYDGFESGWGNWNDGGTYCTLFTNSSFSNTGSRCVYIRDNTGSSLLTSDVLDLTSYSSVDINFSFRFYSMETGEYFSLQVSTNGGSSYTTLQSYARGGTYTNGPYYDISYTYNGPITNNMRFRLRSYAPSGNDYTLIDDIYICGEAAAPNTNPTPSNDNATSYTNAISIDVLANDTDPEGDNLSISSVGAPNNGGSASVIGNQISYQPANGFTGVETFTYQVCDDGSPSLCATASVSVNVIANTAPTANADNATTDLSTPININVLSNDSDPNPGQQIVLSSITVAPSSGGTATINNNGTAGNPADDYIVYTPSGAFVGTETFMYQVCDNGNPNACAVAVVNVNVTTCADGSTAEASPNWSYGSQWKYFDSRVDLGTAWTATNYNDDCWDFGNGSFGFGDARTTVLTNNGGPTYYFRKEFNVADVSAINYLLLNLRRDDGAAVYINGTEVFRSNLPNGSINFNTLASSGVGGSDETASNPIIVSTQHLVNGTNVIAVEVHQTALNNGDLTFDLNMRADMVDHSGDYFVRQDQYWNYNDNNIDLGTSWRNSAYTETSNEWESANAELGYGNAGVNSTIDGGPLTNRYPTYYFRHYFTAANIAAYDSLKIRLLRDDGAIVYINGVEVFRSAMPSGAVNHNTLASETASGSEETTFYEKTVLANMVVNGPNVIAVEVHQRSATSSDVSFNLELLKIAGDPTTYVGGRNTVTGRVFLDSDISKNYSANDIALGAVEVCSYYDVNNNGEIDTRIDPQLFGFLSNPDGTYEVETYLAEVRAAMSMVSSTNDDAIQDGLTGGVSLGKTKHKSIIPAFPSTLLIDSLSTWRYWDNGSVGDPNWNQPGYNDSGWSSGAGDFGFGDPGINTTLTSGNTTYYFRKSINAPAGANNWNLGRIKLKRDDGVVIYVNGTEVSRFNMPEGTILYSTLGNTTISGSEEDIYYDMSFTGNYFNAGNNVIAVEVHQASVGSSDLRFDMRLSAEQSVIADCGLRFNNVQVPQGAQIVDAFIRMTSATTSEEIFSINVFGEATDNATVFSSTPNNISSRTKTTATSIWSNTDATIDGFKFKLDNLRSIVKEITERPGWAAGNSMAFILNGFEKEIYTFDAGNSPELVIAYVDGSATTANYLVGIASEDLPEQHHYTSDPSPAITVNNTVTTYPNNDIAYIGSTVMCFASSDDSYDDLHIINRFSGKNKAIGNFGGNTEIEAIALSANADSLFAADGGAFGLINMNTGAFTPYGNTIGTGNGPLGPITFSDIDGLAYDLYRDILWASHRRSGSGQYDVILVIDPVTGLFVPGMFSGDDYIVAQGGGLEPDLDDIAVNPNTGNLFAMNNNNGAVTNLAEIDITTGTPTVINNTGLNDMEGQGFHNDGLFYSTSGREGVPDNAFYEVDTSNSQLNLIGYFGSAGDFEGCDCKTGPAINMIDGYVFWDVNIDSVYNWTDTIQSGVNVYLYLDADTSGDVTERRAPDPLLQTQVSDENGYFAFTVTQPGIYIVAVEQDDIPGTAVFTTVVVHDARFRVNGNVDLNNNFGFIPPSALLPVELISFTGENKGAENHLNWITATEVNNDYFEVQRSKDALNFETIGQVEGNGTVSTESNYSFIDEDPFTGTNFYRLKQVDFDGTTDFSEIISLDVAASNDIAKNNLELWPNPATDLIKIGGLKSIESSEEVTLVIFDMQGIERYRTTFLAKEADQIEIVIAEFESGMYFAELRSTNNGLIESIDFVKQN